MRKKQSLKRTQHRKADFYLDRGIKKLDRDLDVSQLLEMVQVYRVMKQTLFSQDDRFFLRMQRKDVICSSDTAVNNTDSKNPDKQWKTIKTKATVASILNQDEAINPQQKQNLRKMLERFEGRKLRDREFRILQGILLKDFGELELKRKQ